MERKMAAMFNKVKSAYYRAVKWLVLSSCEILILLALKKRVSWLSFLALIFSQLSFQDQDNFEM